MRLAVVGGGWAGLAAAVEATLLGHRVSLYEMAHEPGGRARRVAATDPALDNGQHILIGAYVETLRLMAIVGADAERWLDRRPLTLAYADGGTLALPPGAPRVAFARAVLGRRGWTFGDRLRLLWTTAGWARNGFRCDPRLTVAELSAALPASARRDLVEPLCVAALNTPAAQASATVFLRVLHDALFGARGSADLLLPRVDLSALWPDVARRWLVARGASLHLGHRVGQLDANGAGWRVDGEAFEGVVLAASSVEAARLAEPHAGAWAETTRALRHEPIVTVVLRSEGTRLPQPMLALHAGPSAPAQFVFDLGELRGIAGMLAFVVSGAAAWVERGMTATVEATLAQARSALGAHLRGPLREVRTVVEKRATFLCTPDLARPAAAIAPGLMAAGDYVDGPYPATLEGAVRSGVAAARAFISAGRTAPPAVRR